MYTPSYLPRGVFSSLFLAKVRSPTGSMRPSLLYVIAVEGMGTGPRGYQVPTSVFPPRCAITHNDEIHGEKSRFFLSRRTAVLRVNPRTFFHPSFSLLHPPFPLSPVSLLLSRPFPRAFVYYMLNYDDLRQCMQNTAPLAARP